MKGYIIKKNNDLLGDFKEKLGFWDSLAIIISITIGVGIFKVPAEVARYLSSFNLILLAWFLGGIISVLGCLCYAELSTSFPKTGGNYIYLKEGYGPWAGFLFGWTELFVVRTGSIAAVAFIFAEYFISFASLDKSLIKSIAVSSVLILSMVNALGLKYSKRVQDMFIISKMVAIIGIVVFGLILKKGNISYLHYSPGGYDKNVFLAFGLALIPILWTYGGWHENTFMAGETKSTGTTLPAALITGISVITAVYLTINFTYLYLIPEKGIVNANLIAADVFQILYGKSGRKILEALIIISSLGCINAMIMTGSRVTYAMARDNIIFKYIGEVNAKRKTPLRAIVINAVWSVSLIILGTFNKLLFFTGIVVWLFFALVIGGLFILRYKYPNIERPYKVWGYPFIPAIYMLICIALAVNTMIFYPSQAVIGLCILLSGLPVYTMSKALYKKSLLTQRYM